MIQIINDIFTNLFGTHQFTLSYYFNSSTSSVDIFSIDYGTLLSYLFVGYLVFWLCFLVFKIVRLFLC